VRAFSESEAPKYVFEKSALPRAYISLTDRPRPIPSVTASPDAEL